MDLSAFWPAFIPLFVAVDAIGILPMFLNLTEGLDKKRLRAVTIQSVLTALGAGVVFLLGGKAVLALLGITIADFMVAGGVLLFTLALRDLLTFEKHRAAIDPESIGPVPVGVPLIVGPAVLTTGIILMDQQGHIVTLAALCANVLIAGVVLWFSTLLLRVLGTTGAKVISKLASLLLAAFAVMMVRKGVEQFLGGG